MTTNNIPAIHSGIGPATATPELLTTIGWPTPSSATPGSKPSSSTSSLPKKTKYSAAPSNPNANP